MKKIFFLAIILTVVAFGCAEKKVVKPSEQPQTGTTEQTGKEGTAAKETVTEEQTAKIQSKELPSKTEEHPGMFPDIHFDYDKYDIREDGKPVLKSLADYLIKNPSEKVLIEGHCDERGTTEYNLSLGERRAANVKKYLVALKILEVRISTISYGKERPLDPGHTEEAWARNRRAHIVVLSR